MVKKKRVIIICPNFPPNPGIGGRRWAKFSKILFQKGYDIWVFSFKGKKKDEGSVWEKDVVSLFKEGRVIQIQRNYPKVLDSYPTNFFQKVKYRLWDFYLNNFFIGNPYDRSLFWHKSLIPELVKKINSKTVIIATGGPFRYLNSLIKFKKSKKVPIIADFRDPWANNKISFNKGSSQKQLREEFLLEEQVVCQFDSLICVDHFHVEYFFNKYKIPLEKIHLIPNGFDKLECKILENETKISSEKIKFIFTGTLYNDAINNFETLINLLKYLKLKNHPTFSLIEFWFHGDIPTIYNKYFDLFPNQLKIGEFLSLDEIQRKIRIADFSIIFLTDELNYTLNTKFLEAINQRNKVLVFSSKGFLTQLVDKEGIGYSMTPQNFKKSFYSCLKDYNLGNNKIQSFPKDLLKFEVNELAISLEFLINEFYKE